MVQAPISQGQGASGKGVQFRRSEYCIVHGMDLPRGWGQRGWRRGRWRGWGKGTGSMQGCDWWRGVQQQELQRLQHEQAREVEGGVEEERGRDAPSQSAQRRRDDAAHKHHIMHVG